MKPGVTEEQYRKAADMLQALTESETFLRPHHRNHDAVNLCICCRVLGIEDPVQWFDNFCRGKGTYTTGEMLAVYKHLDRVKPYALEWGPEGNEGNALEYAL